MTFLPRDFFSLLGFWITSATGSGAAFAPRRAFAAGLAAAGSFFFAVDRLLAERLVVDNFHVSFFTHPPSQTGCDVAASIGEAAADGASWKRTSPRCSMFSIPDAEVQGSCRRISSRYPRRTA